MVVLNLAGKGNFTGYFFVEPERIAAFLALN